MEFIAKINKIIDDCKDPLTQRETLEDYLTQEGIPHMYMVDTYDEQEGWGESLFGSMVVCHKGQMYNFWVLTKRYQAE